MTRTFKHILSATLACAILFSWDNASGQDSTPTFKQADDLMSDVLDLNDPVLSIWPNVNDLEIASLSVAVVALTEAYESDRLDADERTREIQSMVSDAKNDEIVLKDLIRVARKAKDDVEKKRLEALRKFHIVRRKYLERVTKIRDGERQLAETRIDYVNQLEYVLEMATQLVNARATDNVDERLATERELIRQSRELSARLGLVASNLKKVNAERERAFTDREKLIADYH